MCGRFVRPNIESIVEFVVSVGLVDDIVKRSERLQHRIAVMGAKVRPSAASLVTIVHFRAELPVSDIGHVKPDGLARPHF